MFRRVCVLGLLSAVGLVFAQGARGDAIDISLNLLYDNPLDAGAGGNWQLVAKSDQQGIYGLVVELTGVKIGQVQGVGPKGQINGEQHEAGFWLFESYEIDTTHVAITTGQAVLSQAERGSGEQSIFYGVGTLENGWPDYQDAPMGSNSIGPHFDTLSNVSGVPWATGDVLGDSNWDTAFVFASGPFSPGETPAVMGTLYGTLFTSLGTPEVAGTLVEETPSMVVRDNLGLTGGDYNNDGFVNAADYTVWQDTFGSTTDLRADGSSFAPGVPDGVVDDFDYEFWKLNYGAVLGSGSGGAAPLTGVVPEPSTGSLGLWGSVAAACLWARRRGPVSSARRICKKRISERKLLDRFVLPKHNARYSGKATALGLT